MKKLLSESFASDPRVVEAKRLLMEALSDHQRRLDGIRPSEAERRAHYEESVGRLGKVRARPLALPYIGSGLGKGALVELADGSVKLDLISGIGVHCLGHSHPEVVEACFQATLHDIVMQGNLQQNEEALTLSELLLEMANRTGADLTHCFLTTSGAMANENALKIAFQKAHPADRLLAFEGGFAGRSLALSQVTDRADYRRGLPGTVEVDYIPFYNSDRPDQSTERALEALRGHLARHPGRHAAMCFELVLGEGGFYEGRREFFVPLMDLLKRAGISILIDEIQTFGRTEQPFSFQHFGLDPYVDLVTVGKLTQACATLFKEELKPSAELVSQTFIASTSALTAGLAILKHLVGGGYFGPEGKNAQIQEQFHTRLTDLATRHPSWIKGPFGLGTMIAFTPLDGSKETARALVQTLFTEGVAAYTAGEKPCRIRFLVPAGAVTLEDIDKAFEILERCLATVAGDASEKGTP